MKKAPRKKQPEKSKKHNLLEILLKKESRMVKKNSLEVLEELERLGDDKDLYDHKV